MKDRTDFSDEIAGNEGNHDLPVRYDMTDGYLGISQTGDRVLLSPKQVAELTRFIEQKRR
jgi:hypothetical protein